MINKIGKITLYVNNQEEAKEFWTKKLNFVVKVEKEIEPNMKWLEVGPSEDEFTTLALYDKKFIKVENEKFNIFNPSIILSTSDIIDTYNEFKNNDVEVGEIMKMQYGNMFTFKDQDGNKYLVREDSH